MLTIRNILLLVVLSLVSGCGLQRVEPAPVWPTATTMRADSTPLPPNGRELHDVADAADLTVSERPIVEQAIAETDCASSAGEAATRHVVNAVINYADRTAAVEQRIRYVNQTNSTLDELVLNVEANQWVEVFTLNALTLEDGSSPAFELTGRRLTVYIPGELQPGCPFVLDLVFELAVPVIEPGNLRSYRGFLGYTNRQLNLGHWLPTTAVRLDGAWITRETTFVGEQVVLNPADWEVNLEVIGAASEVTVAGPGTVSHIGNRWRFVHNNSRDFTISLSDSFDVLSQTSDTGVLVEVFSLPGSQAPLSSDGTSAEHALDVSVRSLEMFSDLFTAYPYERMVVVEGDFPDGMEFSGIMFVSTDWFRSFTGDPASYLTLITVHEVSHQWWYASVGNDSALSPWLDEALATYSEYIFLEEYDQNLKDWWWDFRVDRYSPTGSVDATVYEFESIREYINAVYLRGVMMLHDIRSDIGTEAFFEWLRHYAEVGDGRVMSSDMLWQLLDEEQLAATQETRAAYLQLPDPQ